MAILITGGTGFLGAGLARKLLERGEDVVLFDVFPRLERIPDIKDKVKVIQGDLKVWPEVLNAVKDNKVEGVFHLGAMLSLPSEENPWASFQTNVAGTMYILEAARLFGVERTVFASSGATYGLGIQRRIQPQMRYEQPCSLRLCSCTGHTKRRVPDSDTMPR